MRILLPTGTSTEETVKKAASGLDARVVITGEVASFLSPTSLVQLIRDNPCDAVIISGMCTARFERVEEETGVPVYRGPRHAADLGPVLAAFARGCTLSRVVPADELLRGRAESEAKATLQAMESGATPEFLIRGLMIGGDSRMKVLAEIQDAHRVTSVRETVERYHEEGADIVDLGFGFDATPEDVTNVFGALQDVSIPLAVDSQDPELIRAALYRADLVLSLQEENIPLIAREVAEAGAAAVIVPGKRDLETNLESARAAGIECLVADPLLMPAGSGFVRSLVHDRFHGFPVFFGAGNVVELIDADSPGINALLAAMASELGSAIIFTSEHSDKTRGSVREMRRAVEMMALARGRPYPKDLGLDLLVIKEKRRKEEPPLKYRECIDGTPPPVDITYDPKGNFRIGLEGGMIVAVCNGRAIRGRTWDEVFQRILEDNGVSLMDHAAYLGKELYKAELALRFGRSFEQDGPF